ncbi:SPRY domain-containing 3, partial [Brachionus plicatilis]
SRGDSMALEMEVFEPDMSVAIFSKNFKPVGTRFLTLKDFNEFLPTFAVQNNGEEFEMNVYWHTVVSMPPHFNVRNPEDWCYPEGTKIDPRDKAFVLPHHYDHSVCLQAPYSLHHKYNHFEIVLSDDFDKNNPPPAIALCTACPFDPPPVSQFKQDYLRFWPTGE